MYRVISRAKGLAQAGLAVGLVMICPGWGFGQQAAPAPLPAARGQAAPTPSAVVPLEVVAPSQTAVEGAPDGACCGEAKAEPKSPWAKVPPLGVLPRPGQFIIPPTGEGYYSLKGLILGDHRDKPPKNPYPPVGPDIYSFYDADFRYLEDPENTQTDLFDPLKRIHLGDNWLLSFGGEERVRYMHEAGGYARFTGKDNDYTLIRSRVYGDLWLRDLFRVYAEFYDAQITGNDLAPLPIDVNHSDFLNLFAELKIFALDDHPAYVRAGRQEMYFGSQRLISPLDWANTRRTFQGVRGYWHGDNLDVDAFWVQPVLVNSTHFDAPDDGQQFAGSWLTYRPAKGQTLDLYYLYLENTRPNFTGLKNARGGFHVDTFGSRYAGDYHHFLWDFEGMYQFGHFVNQETSAGAVTTGIGYQFANLPLDPQFWIYNDYASGDHNGGRSGGHGTFNQLFPFGHYYFGYLDVVGRQNIDDLNLQAVVFPAKWVTTGLQYHVFRLDAAKDALYSASGTVLRRDPSGRAGTDVGDEIDWFTNFHLSPHQDLLLGYSKLFSGAFIRGTGPAISPEFFYAQYSFKW